MTVGLVIVSHSARLAQGVVELVGQMTQGNTPLAAAGGAENDILGTSTDKIMSAIQSVDNPDGVLVLLDLGSAILSAEMAVEMLEAAQQAHIRLSYAPLVEGAVAAALAASLGQTLTQVKQAAEKAADADQLRQFKPLDQAAEETPPPSDRDEPVQEVPDARSSEVQLTITNPTGLHARPASLFVQSAGHFQASIQAFVRNRQANARSILEVLALGARRGDTITLRAGGADADKALLELSQLIQANFYEGPETASAPAVTSEPQSTAVKARSQGALPEHEPWSAISTSPGIALGPAFIYGSDSIDLSTVPEHTILPEQETAQQQLLQETLTRSAQELEQLARQVQQRIGETEGRIFTAQALMLRDPSLLTASQKLIHEQQLDAASALARAGAQQAQILEQLTDPLIAVRAVDIRDAIGRTIRALRGEDLPKQNLQTLQQPVILLARDLTPSDTAQLRPETVLGICTIRGGPNAHAAILARALGIPAIAGLNEAALRTIHSGDSLALDAEQGLLYHNPAPEVTQKLRQRHDMYQQQRATMQAAAQQSQAPLIINHRHISLFANIGSEAEAEAARQWGAEGIGLLRTEFLFASAATLPDENEQRQRYAQVFRAFRGPATHQTGAIVVRTLDVGADKPMPALDKLFGSNQEANPALGLRGIRIHLAHQELLAQQLRALLLAASDTEVALHIMFPMITTVEELRTARAIFDRVYAEIRQQVPNIPEHVPVGIMIEVPAAALMAAELAEIADFFSIGANDLLQYTVAADRTNGAVSYLYQPMQPALLRLIKQVAIAGRKAGKPVAVCGEIASNEHLAPLLIGLGVDELSMTPTAIPTIKAALMQTTPQSMTRLAERILHLGTATEIAHALQHDTV